MHGIMPPPRRTAAPDTPHPLPQVIHKVIIEHKRPELPASTPPEITQLVEDCWQKSADARPSFQQLVARLEELLTRSSQLVAQAEQADSGFVTDF
jgi:hypothetical protein